MNYSTDKPIDKKEQDLLGRASFSIQFGKAIYEYNGKDGLVIGLFGKWGTGKTSVINMATNEINRLAENDKNNKNNKNNKNKPMIMRFSPWNYSDKDNLISLFFQSLKNKIYVQDDKELKKKIGKALSDYAGALDALSVVPVFGSGVAAILKTIAQAQGANLMQGADLDETRKILEKSLIAADKKIIILIDDIDRLINSQIRDIFQLVKQVADFPNVIYVLAMDREVVSRALTEVHNIDGNEYLEKIIQVQFDIPGLRKSKLHSIFFDKLNHIIDNLPDKVILDDNYWNDVFRNCIEPYINTLRDVNRLINTFQFRYGMLYQETSFEDMIGLTTLEVLEPKLYNWICNNKDAVCGGFMHGLLSIGGNKPDYHKRYRDEFQSLKIDPDLAISCISTMFPVFAKDVNEYKQACQQTSDIRGKMRIAHEERFELYFMFDLDDIKVSRSIINGCVHEFDRDALSKVIEEINKQGNIVYFLEEMGSLVDRIPYERLELIASVILDSQCSFEDEKRVGILSMSAYHTAEYFVYNIIKMLKTEEEKYKTLRLAVENVSKNGLGIMARLINKIEFAYGRLEANSEKKDDQIITLEHLEALKNIYIEKINAIANSEPILDMNEFNIVFSFWKCLDKVGAEEYREELFANEVNKLKFICTMAVRWNSTNGSGWKLYLENYSEYFSKEEIYDMIQSFDKNKLDEFTEIEQIKLASFALNYDKSNMNDVNEQEALELVNQWKVQKNQSTN